MHASIVVATFAAAIAQVSGHGLILASTGANGISTTGFGVIAGTPRDSPKAGAPEQDTSIIRDKEIASGKASACGRTQGGGAVDIAAEMQKAVTNGLADAAADGSVTMTLHQVNGDGAGPYTCAVDATGTGSNFVAMTVTQNIPGTNSRSKARATNFQLVAQMPAGTTCAGPGGACLVRCRNAANAGPFGGCAAVTNAGGNSTATSSATGTGSAVGSGTAASGTSVQGASGESGTAASGTAAGTSVQQAGDGVPQGSAAGTSVQQAGDGVPQGSAAGTSVQQAGDGVAQGSAGTSVQQAGSGVPQAQKSVAGSQAAGKLSPKRMAKFVKRSARGSKRNAH